MMSYRPGPSLSPPGAIVLVPASLLCLAQKLTGLFQLPLHSPRKTIVPIEPAKLGTRSLLGELRPPIRFRGCWPTRRLPFCWLNRSTPAFAIFGIFQIIRMHLLPLRLELTAAGWQPPARADTPMRWRVALLCGAVGRMCSVIFMRTQSAKCRFDTGVSMSDDRGAILTTDLRLAKHTGSISQ